MNEKVTLDFLKKGAEPGHKNAVINKYMGLRIKDKEGYVGYVCGFTQSNDYYVLWDVNNRTLALYHWCGGTNLAPSSLNKMAIQYNNRAQLCDRRTTNLYTQEELREVLDYLKAYNLEYDYEHQKTAAAHKIKVGDIKESANCGPMEVLEIGGNSRSKNHLYIRFINTGTEKWISGSNWATGGVKDPMCPISSIHPGCIGIGPYNSKKDNAVYCLWLNRMRRGYNKAASDYTGVPVAKEWWIFQNFAEWYYEHYPKCDNENISWELDKDLLARDGQKIYSPETCCFLPKMINGFINDIGKTPETSIIRAYKDDATQQVLYCVSKVIYWEDEPMLGFTSYDEAYSVAITKYKSMLLRMTLEYKQYLEPRAVEALLCMTEL